MSYTPPDSDSPTSQEAEGSSAPMSKDELWALVKAKRNPNAPAPVASAPAARSAAPAPAPESQPAESPWERAAREEAERQALRARARAERQAAAAAEAAAQAEAAAAEEAARPRRAKPAPFQRQFASEEEPFVEPEHYAEPEQSSVSWQLPTADSEESYAHTDSTHPTIIYTDSAVELNTTEPEVLLSLDSTEVEKPADNTSALKEAKKTALISSISSCLGLLLLLGVIRIAMPEPMPAEIVAFAEAEDEQTETNSLKKVAQALPQAAPMAASLMPITASGVSDIAVPQITTTLSGSDLNIGTTLGSFGSGLSNGTAGGTVSFLGNRSAGKRIVFVVDVSSSMNASGELNGQRISRFDLLKKELTRSVNGLPNGVQYQIIFFSDFGWAHDAIRPGDEEARMNLQWDITPDTIAEAKIPKVRYRTANLGNIKTSREIIAKAENPGGTNWGSGLFIALKMSPPPDVIFFMTDGNASDDSGWSAAVSETNARQGGKTIINTSAMMEPDAAVSLSDMAINNGGSFTVVLPNGKVVKGEDWFKGVRQ